MFVVYLVIMSLFDLLYQNSYEDSDGEVFLFFMGHSGSKEVKYYCINNN